MENKFTRRGTFDKPDKTVDFSKYSASLHRMRIYEEKQLQENTTEFDIQTRRKKELFEQIAKLQEDFQTDLQLIQKTCEKSLKKLKNCLLKSDKTQQVANADLLLSTTFSNILQILISEDKEDKIKQYQNELDSQIISTDKQLKSLEKQWKEMNTTSSETTLLTENYFKLKEQYDNLPTYIQTSVEFEMNEAKNKIKDLKENLTDINSEITKARLTLMNQENANVSFNRDIFTPLQNYSKLVEKENMEMNNEIVDLQSNIDAGKIELEEINQQIKQLENEISLLSQEILPH